MKMYPAWWDDIQYFIPSEFDCKGGGKGTGANMDEEFVRRLDQLRHLFRKPIIINSGYRTMEHNQRVGGSPLSMHLFGRAADIRIAGKDAYELVGLAMTLGFSGIGINQKGDWEGRFIHLDSRDQEKPAIWSY